MTNAQDLVWILDNDPACIALYQQTIGIQYKLRLFSSVRELTQALSSARPSLLLADPERTEGSLREALAEARARTDVAVPWPEYAVVTANDDLEPMRFHLKAGARDYIFKPLRPNELVAKVENILLKILNREFQILRNDFDGITVSDLTFREHQMLTVFLMRPNRCVYRETLHAAIWNQMNVNRKTLDVHLFSLRRKLRPHGYEIIYNDQHFSLQPRVSEVGVR